MESSILHFMHHIELYIASRTTVCCLIDLIERSNGEILTFQFLTFSVDDMVSIIFRLGRSMHISCIVSIFMHTQYDINVALWNGKIKCFRVLSQIAFLPEVLHFKWGRAAGFMFLDRPAAE